jgi:hypothetical protein
LAALKEAPKLAIKKTKDDGIYLYLKIEELDPVTIGVGF